MVSLTWPQTCSLVLGVDLRLNPDLAQVRYFGRGPRENYVDSREAGLLGVYTTDVDSLFTNYVVPQANGNHLDTKWASLTDERGQGMLFSNPSGINFSASYYEHGILMKPNTPSI